MKKLGLLLIAILAMSMIAMIAAPVLAARTPKANQVFVKVVDNAGNPVGKAYVVLALYDSSGVKVAGTSWLATKGSGMAVFSLAEVAMGTWNYATSFSVTVKYNDVNYDGGEHSFSSTFSANIEVKIPI